MKTKLNECIVYNTCIRVYESKVIDYGMCLPVAVTLMKYFQFKDIPIKVHLCVIDNKSGEYIHHNWISYNGKKCDITADKQKEGFESDVIILDKKITNKFKNTEIKKIDEELFPKLYLSSYTEVKEMYPRLNDHDKIELDMISNAMETDDSSFENSIIDKFFNQQNTEFKEIVKNINKDTSIKQLIEFIKCLSDINKLS